jgi:hypothetical protein
MMRKGGYEQEICENNKKMRGGKRNRREIDSTPQLSIFLPTFISNGTESSSASSIGPKCRGTSIGTNVMVFSSGSSMMRRDLARAKEPVIG